jgi:phage recombination protein Bet
MNGNSVALRPELTNGSVPMLVMDDEKRDLLKRTICKGATDDELELALAVAGRMGLDPFARQVAFIKRWDSSEKRQVMTIQPTIDGARLLAQRSGRYGGQLGPWWCGKDGTWVEVWLEDGPPAAAKIGVINTQWREPLFAIARFDSYCAKKDGRPVALWATMPDLMIAKCAEMLALRRAFPAEFSDFTDDEQFAVQETVNAGMRVVEVDGVAADAATGEIVSIDEFARQPSRGAVFGRLHKVGEQRGLSHDELKEVVRHFFPDGTDSLQEMGLDDLSAVAGKLERASDADIALWLGEGDDADEAESDPEPIGPELVDSWIRDIESAPDTSALAMLGEQLQGVQLDTASHNRLKLAYSKRARYFQDLAAKERAQLQTLDEAFGSVTSGEAGDDRFTG